MLTVSGQFALDIFGDPLQTQVMADHLSSPLSGRLVGVNNGPFIDLEIDPSPLQEAERGNYSALFTWKADNRNRALEALHSFGPTLERPLWGDRTRILACAERGDPLFVMAGRDDSRQKGYDVAALAISQFLRSGGKASFFFFPVPGDEGLPGIAFLQDLANELPDNVVVFPFRWVEGFSATLRGASFGLMPSLYEPFGMANEFYLRGTVGIGRATGGIVQQIVPLRGCGSFSLAAEEIANRWHSSSASPTGFLYRESVTESLGSEGWRHINSAAYELVFSDN